MRLVLALFLLALPALAPGGNIGAGSTTCPASGVKALSTTATKASWIALQAPTTNTGAISLGGQSVTTTTGTSMSAGGTAFLPPLSNTAPYTLTGVFIACTQSADKVLYTYF